MQKRLPISEKLQFTNSAAVWEFLQIKESQLHMTKTKMGIVSLVVILYCVLANYLVLQRRRGMFCYNWANWDGFARPWQFSDGGAVLLRDQIIQCANTMQIQQ